MRKTTSLLLLIYSLIWLPFSTSSTTSSTRLLHDFVHRFLKEDVLPPGHSNDLSHCLKAALNKDWREDDTVGCDPTTYLWALAELSPNTPPARCAEYNMTELDPSTLSENDDYIEPCIWWHLVYGDFVTSQNPSASPTINIVATTEAPTATPSSSAPTPAPSASTPIPSAAPSASPSINMATKPSRPLSDFVLTLTLPISRRLGSERSRRHLQPVTPELVSITQTHLQQYLQDALGLDILAIDLTSVATEYTSTYLLEEMEGGTVYFPQGSVVPTTSTLDLLVQNAFVGVALDDYLLILQTTAMSPILKSTIYAELMMDDDDAAAPPANGGGVSQQQGNSIFDGFEWTTPWIIIVAAGGAAILSVCCLAYLLFSAKSRRRSQQQRSSLAKAASNDTPLTFGPDEPDVFRDDDDAGSYCSGSDGTSVYSYKQHDDSSVSLAPSFLHAINERSALGAFYDTDDDSMKASSLVWHESGDAQSNPSSPNRPPSSSRRPDSVVITPKNGDEYNAFHQGLRREHEELQLDGNSSVTDRSWLKDEGPSMIEGDQSSWMGGVSLGDYDNQQASLYLDTDDDDSLLRKSENHSQSQEAAQPVADFSNLWEDEEEKKNVDLPVDVSFEEKDGSFENASVASSELM